MQEKRDDIWTYPGPSVTKRIDMAVKIAMHSGSQQNVVQELSERIGSGPAIAETVPTALGILISNQGRTMESIYDAVNIGDETSAIGCIVGQLQEHSEELIPLRKGIWKSSKKKIRWIYVLRQKGLKNCGEISHRIGIIRTGTTRPHRRRAGKSVA